MATADFAPVDRFVQVPLARGFHAIVRWIAARRAARAKREELLSLLFAPEHRLRDVGITRAQLIREIEAQGTPVRASEHRLQK